MEEKQTNGEQTGSDRKAMEIRIIPEGPYEVNGSVPLDQEIIVPDAEGAGERWEKGPAYPGRETYFLCRCGHSRNKPYCDGAHAGHPFHSRETADRTCCEERVRVYQGEAIDLVDRESLCAVARFCDRFQGVWKLTVLSGQDPEYEKTATYMASACPAGRLTVRRKDGTPVEPKLEKEISLVEDSAKNCRGPLWVKGGIPIRSSNGTVYEIRNRVTLCRCGQSRNMPFCDAAHLRSKKMKGLDEAPTGN